MKSNQNTAWCNDCNGFIKNISQGKPPQLHFGKYNGCLISDLVTEEHLKYLNWLIEQPFCKSLLKSQIQSHLDNLKK